MSSFELVMEGNKISIEQQANYQENYTILLITRLQNPLIMERLVKMFELHNATLYAPENIDNPTATHEIVSTDREVIIRQIKEKIEFVISRTEISFTGSLLDSNACGAGLIGLASLDDLELDKKVSTDLARNIAEAHEKGHVVREFLGFSKLTDRILSGFDFTNIELSKEELEILQSLSRTDPSDVEDLINYNKHPMEIIERMAQLKNYFGMSGDDKFTKKHLQYVRNHYAQDTGFGYQINTFLSAITPATEDTFIELINTLGI